MAAVDRFSGLLLAVLLIAAGVNSPINAAEPLSFDKDGWYSWSVASVEDFEEELFYVMVKSGEAKKIHVAGQWCNHWSRNGRHSTRNFPEAVDLGFIETDRSIDFFEKFIGKRNKLSSDALAAISQHEGERAVQIMIDIVESDAPMDVREEAVFWMVQSESKEAFAYLDRLLMLD